LTLSSSIFILKTLDVLTFELCQGTPVDMISDNEESCRSGSVSSASDHVEHEGKF